MDVQNPVESMSRGETLPVITESLQKECSLASDEKTSKSVSDETGRTTALRGATDSSTSKSDSTCPTFQDKQSGVSQNNFNRSLCDIESSESCFNCGAKGSNLPDKGEQSETESCDNLENSSDSNSKSKMSDGSVAGDECIENSAVEPEDDARDHNRRRTRRNSKRKWESGECCPVCGVTVRLPELEVHFKKEVENLSKIPKSLKKNKSEEKGISTTFVQVKSNRENRLSAKVARYAAKDKSQIDCPVCNLQLKGAQEEINKHVLNCINEDESSEEYVVVDDNFEEYEFADQTRVRAISFVPGGYGSLHGLSSKKHKNTENDEELNVDVDDTMTFGKPQYTEMDVIHNTTDVTETKELEQLRKAVLTDPSIQPHVIESRKWSSMDGEDNKDTEPCREQNSVFSSLKEKIKDLEDNKIVKCLICLEPYTKPVVSTTCWHVHCEECWLMTMGVKKLCPQCNMIVFPSDLRRIYL